MRIQTVMDGLEVMIKMHQGEIDSELRLAGESRGIRSILPYWTDTVEDGEYPILMLKEGGKSAAWYGLPNIKEERFQVSIYGYIHHDNLPVAVRMRRAFADAVEECLNKEHEGILTARGGWIEFTSQNPPVVSVQYDAPPVAGGNSVFLHGFTITWQSECHPIQPIG